VVTFHKIGTDRPTAWWEAVRKSGGVVRGGYMPIGCGVIPHDLAHMATESVLGLTDGCWGLLARGATYRHGTRQRATRRGRELIRDNRVRLHEAEQLGNHRHGTWMRGAATPVGPVFERLAAAWSAVPQGGQLVVCWPTLDICAPADATP